jgi:hypothetical protein
MNTETTIQIAMSNMNTNVNAKFEVSESALFSGRSSFGRHPVSHGLVYRPAQRPAPEAPKASDCGCLDLGWRMLDPTKPDPLV